MPWKNENKQEGLTLIQLNDGEFGTTFQKVMDDLAVVDLLADTDFVYYNDDFHSFATKCIQAAMTRVLATDKRRTINKKTVYALGRQVSLDAADFGFCFEVLDIALLAASRLLKPGLVGIAKELHKLGDSLNNSFAANLTSGRYSAGNVVLSETINLLHPEGKNRAPADVVNAFEVALGVLFAWGPLGQPGFMAARLIHTITCGDPANWWLPNEVSRVAPPRQEVENLCLRFASYVGRDQFNSVFEELRKARDARARAAREEERKKRDAEYKRRQKEWKEAGGVNSGQRMPQAPPPPVPPEGPPLLKIVSNQKLMLTLLHAQYPEGGAHKIKNRALFLVHPDKWEPFKAAATSAFQELANWVEKNPTFFRAGPRHKDPNGIIQRPDRVFSLLSGQAKAYLEYMNLPAAALDAEWATEATLGLTPEDRQSRREDYARATIPEPPVMNP
jgi:hypothetical protein